MIAMRGQITAKVRQELVPALGLTSDSAQTGSTHPKNEEAYDIYLRSIAVPHDPQPNKEAIAMLERAVGLDPSYAPAWAALGLRYYYDAQYGGAGEEAFQRSNAADERALALDPNLVSAAGYLITKRVERGELAAAYRDAKALVQQHPEKGESHFALAYVLRYGGALDESARECDTARSIDPGNYGLRSCALTFDHMGDDAKALEFLQLDMGSRWVLNNLARHYMRAGNLVKARELIERVGDNPLERLSKACLNRPSSAEFDSAVNGAETAAFANPDAENRYVAAETFSFCGQKETAMRLLQSSIAGNYCADKFPADPMLANLRDMPEFNQALSAAKKCHADFQAGRSQAAN